VFALSVRLGLPLEIAVIRLFFLDDKVCYRPRSIGEPEGGVEPHVPKNWRLTFWIDSGSNEVRDMNLEDCY
jgi:hypothetical protein